MSKQNCVKWDKKAKDDKCTCTYISVPPPHLMLKCSNLVRQLYPKHAMGLSFSSESIILQ